MKALILVADGFENLTLFLPWYRLREENLDVRLASPLMHALTGMHDYQIEPDLRIHEVNPAEYDVLVIPDGRAVEMLRQREEAVDVTRTFMQDGSSRVAAIGHGAQLRSAPASSMAARSRAIPASATTSAPPAPFTATRPSSATATCLRPARPTISLLSARCSSIRSASGCRRRQITKAREKESTKQNNSGSCFPSLVAFAM